MTVFQVILLTLLCIFLYSFSDRNLAKIYLLLEGLLPSFAVRMHFPEDKFRKIRKIYSKLPPKMCISDYFQMYMLEKM